MSITTILNEIGNTPIVEGKKNFQQYKPTKSLLYFKLEYFNPAQSIKDRTALGLIESAEKSGLIRKGDSIIESTSGNLGHSLAMICAIKGYNFICILDVKTPADNINILKAFGSEVIIVETPDETGSFQKKRVKMAKEIAKKRPRTFNLDQYNNHDAIDFHYRTTGPEIYSQLENVNVIFGSISTGSHLSGVAKFFKENKKNVKIIAVEPMGSVISGGEYKPFLQNGAGLSFVPGNYISKYIDFVMRAPDKESFQTCRSLAKEQGLFVGGSSGGVVNAMYEYARLNKDSKLNLLGILPDGGVKYSSTVFCDEWLTENLTQI